MFPSVSKKQKPHTSHVGEGKEGFDHAVKIKRQNRGLWRIMVLLVGQGGGSSRRDGVTTKSLQLVEEAQETSAPQCLLRIQCD